MSNHSVPTRPRALRDSPATDGHEGLEPLFARLTTLGPTDDRRTALRDELIGRCLPLAEYIARRYAGRTENPDDLQPCVRAGVTRAVDRFAPEPGASFLAFAVPVIMGEIRRHLRDSAWAQRIQQRQANIQRSLGPAVEVLCTRLGHMPNVTELAAELGVDRIDVTRALVARWASRTSSPGIRAACDPRTTRRPAETP